MASRRSMEEELDEATRKVGGYKPYKITVFGLVALSTYLPLCYQVLIIVFIGYTPPHHCKVPANQTLNETIPHTIENGEIVWDKCNMYANFSLDNSTIPCTNGWTYYAEGYSTMVTEWDFVCDMNYVPDMLQSTYQICVLGAELGWSFVIDRFGRKPLHVVSCVMVAVSGSLMAISVNLTMFIVLRSISAVLIVAVVSTGLTWSLEYFDSSKRAFAGIGLETGWLVAFLPLSLFAWLITDWRYLQFTLSVINIVWIVLIWTMHESVPWLVVTGKFDEANTILNTTARRNGVKLEEPINLENIEEMEVLAGKHSKQKNGAEPEVSTQESSMSPRDRSGPRNVNLKDVLELVKNPTLLKHLLISMILWFANCFVYYDIVLFTPMLPGDRFVNFFIMAVVEIPAFLLAFFIVIRFGRRIPLCLLHIGAGLPLLCVEFIPKTTSIGVNLSITLVMLGKFGISASFAVMILFTNELFPTCLRATAGGINKASCGLASVLAPMVIFIGKTHTYWLPSILGAIVSIVAGLAALVPKDTSDKPLPQTPEDIVKWYRKTRYLEEPNEDKKMAMTVTVDGMESSS